MAQERHRANRDFGNKQTQAIERIKCFQDSYKRFNTRTTTSFKVPERPFGDPSLFCRRDLIEVLRYTQSLELLSENSL